MNTINNEISTKKGFLFLFAILMSAYGFNAMAQEGCLNVCPNDAEKQISVSGENPDVINGVVCIDNLSGANFVIQNGDALSSLPQAQYTCYTVSVSNVAGEGFDIASGTYSIGNIKAELDIALTMSEECGSVSPEATIIDVNTTYCTPTDKICILDVCLCEAESGTDFVFGYTPTGDAGEEVFIVVDNSGTVVTVASSTTISAIGLAEGNYEIYAIIYDLEKAGNLANLLSAGNALADIQSELTDTACGTISDSVEATVNADSCNCDGIEPPEPADCATEICPCNGDLNEIKLSTTNYTSGANQQWYVVVSGGNIVLAQQATAEGSVSIADLPDGSHQIYAVNYNPADNPTLAAALAGGNAWAAVAEGITDKTYCADYVGPKDISINAAECGCEPPVEGCNEGGVDNNAGVMPYTQGLDVCYGNAAIASTVDVVINAGSSLSYILHNGDNADVDLILDYNSTGIFTNDGNYPTNIQLYICAVVSPSVNPDLNNECTDISDNCTPVRFLTKVDINTEIVCGSGTYTVIFELSGGLPAAESGNFYNVDGDYTGLVAPNKPTSISTLSAGAFYSLNVADDAGCSVTIDSEKIVCEKLPIELISYSGAVKAQGNMLKWITASEVENDYFTLKRSVDGINFQSIHTQKGAGTTSTPKSYSYLDREAPSGLSYYKLWQTDNDGTIHDVGIISLTRGETSLNINSLLPIPVLSYLELTYTSNIQSQVQLQIYNALGKKLGSNTVGAIKGLNEATIDVSTYASGIYFLTIIQGEHILTEKFIKE